jgi:two-component system cell cycle sensor histidine kinase/response regulator CckA
MMDDCEGRDGAPAVLVVEDDEDLAELVRMRLELEGQRVEAVHSVADALDAIAERPPALILLDLILGEQNGRDLVRALDRRGDLPAFVVMTAHGDEQVAVEMMRLGARDYVVKDENLLTSLPRRVKRVLTEIETASRLAEAEAALRRSDRTYRRLFDALEDVFWVASWNTREIVYASPAYESVWGMDVDELYRNPLGWTPYIHPDDRERAVAAFSRLAEIGAYDEEYRIVRPDGRVRLVRDRCFAVLNHAGSIHQVVGVAQDVTDARRAQEIERALQHIHRSTVEEADLNGLLTKIRRHLGVLLDTTNFYLAHYDAETETYRFLYYTGQRTPIDPGRSVHIPKSLTDYVRRTGRAKLVDNGVLRDLAARGEIKLTGDGSLQWLGAPLKKDGEVFGVIAVQSYDDPTLYRGNDVRLLEAAAAPIAIGVAHKLAEDAVRISEERLRNIVEHSTNLFYSHTTDHVLTYVSPQCREILDCEPEEALTNWTDFMTDNPSNERGLELTERAISDGERQPPYNLELKTKTGRKVWVEVREAPLVENGETTLIVGALTDISDQMKAESALAASEKRYRQLFERNVAGVYRSTVDGELLSCNMAVAKMFAYASPEEAKGARTVFHYQSREDREWFIEELRKHGSVVGWEVALKRRNGEPLTAILSANLVEDEQGGPAIIEGSLIDISERRKLEGQLAQAQKLEALGQLAGGIAHDFNNLLMSISGSTELLALSYLHAGGELGELKVIREAIKRGAELTHRLLAIARQQILEMEVLDLRSVIQDEIEILRRVIPENIELLLGGSAEVPAVRADRGQIGQVLLNMVVNARDAIQEGGKIEIGIEQRDVDGRSRVGRTGVAEGSYVCVSIEDSGIGMNAATLAHVFEPFFTTKLEEKGIGMGLATVYGIVRQHGGFIDVQSAPGKGTRFEIFLPVATGPVREESDSGEREAEGGDETVLVVEDEPAVRSAIVGMLEALGYGVIEATNGKEALDVLIRDAQVDLVVSDVVMPSIGGRKLLERARATHPRLAFLFSSGYTDEALRDLLETVDGTSFIAKPFTVAQLARAVRQALESRE